MLVTLLQRGRAFPPLFVEKGKVPALPSPCGEGAGEKSGLLRSAYNDGIRHIRNSYLVQQSLFTSIFGFGNTFFQKIHVNLYRN